MLVPGGYAMVLTGICNVAEGGNANDRSSAVTANGRFREI